MVTGIDWLTLAAGMLTLIIWLAFVIADRHARVVGWRPRHQAQGMILINILLLLPFAFAILELNVGLVVPWIVRWALLSLACLGAILDALWLAYFVYLWRVRRRPLPRKQDYIVVLGCFIGRHYLSPFLKWRCDLALQIYQRSPGAKLVLCGGQGSDETMSEAQAMCRYLRSQGVPTEQMILEQRSTSTSENLRFARRLIKRDWHDNGDASITLVTNDYHVLRALAYAHRLRWRINGAGAVMPMPCLINQIAREYGALLKMNPVGVVGMVVLSILAGLFIMV